MPASPAPDGDHRPTPSPDRSPQQGSGPVTYRDLTPDDLAPDLYVQIRRVRVPQERSSILYSPGAIARIDSIHLPYLYCELIPIDRAPLMIQLDSRYHVLRRVAPPVLKAHLQAAHYNTTERHNMPPYNPEEPLF